MKGRPIGLRKGPIAPKRTLVLGPNAQQALGLSNLAGTSATSGALPQPDDLESPMPAAPAPLTPPAGATDGLGMGTGGLAIHPSLKPHNIAGREPKHTSKLR